MLRQNPAEPGSSLLSNISHIRVQVEQTRVEVLKFLKRRWAGVRQEGGFDNLEGWALKEISDGTIDTECDKRVLMFRVDIEDRKSVV